MRGQPDQPDPGLLTGRYARQIVYRNMGPDAQRKLARSRVVLVGCGAMGGMQANILVRAGVGWLRIVDPDVAELDNLQRQVLFDEDDVADRAHKAQAARDKLQGINTDVIVEAEVTRAKPHNIERLIEGADLMLDGTDDLQTRYVMNDAAVKHGLPWVYGGVVADYGSVMSILPGQTPCLRCLFPDPSDLAEVETCQTVGVLASAVGVVASLQAVEAIKILTGQLEALNRKLVTVDVWAGRLDAVAARRDPDCPCCGQRRFEFLTRPRAG